MLKVNFVTMICACILSIYQQLKKTKTCLSIWLVTKRFFKSSPFACCTLRAHFPWSPLKTQMNKEPSAIWQNKESELPLNIRQNCQSHACCSWHLKSYRPHYDIFTQPNLKPLLYCSVL